MLERTGSYIHLTYDNVNDAFEGLVCGFDDRIFHSSFTVKGKVYPDHKVRFPAYTPPLRRTTSRNGDCLTIEEPVIITYRRPRYRVLFSKGRDANPFFHIVEALWMLAGRNDVAPLAYYAAQMKEYSDDGETLWGAYGHRWGSADQKAQGFGGGFFPHPDYSEPDPDHRWLGMHYDQLTDCIELLKREPNGRRCILQMWSPEDLYRVIHFPDCKDVPCNLSVKFRLREEPDRSVPLLDMTVDNRSNDAIWGMLGSNYVTFSFLQEYVALAIGANCGLYHQISNNLHVYLPQKDQPPARNHFQPDKWLEDSCNWYNEWHDPIVGSYPVAPMFDDDVNGGRDDFDEDCRELFAVPPDQHCLVTFKTKWMLNVVHPMLAAWRHHKARHYDLAIGTTNKIQAPDWKIACEQWLKRRAAAHAKASDAGVGYDT